MVAVYWMAPQAALLEQSLAVGHRRPACIITRARRAWSLSVPVGTLLETTPGQWPAGDHPLVHRAGKGSERRPQGVTSPFRAATTEGNRFTHSVDRSPEGSRISWANWCPKRRSASVRLKRSTMPWSLWMSTRPRRTWTECFASS